MLLMKPSWQFEFWPSVVELQMLKPNCGPRPVGSVSTLYGCQRREDASVSR